MPSYQVILRGQGIELPVEGEAQPIVGFYTTRAVTAQNPEDAVRIASEIVAAEWRDGEYAALNRGGSPILSAERVFGLSILRRWFGKPKGYSFYTREDTESVA